MKVKATRDGFHGSRRKAGDVFDVPEGSKAKWFVAATQEVVRAKPGPKPKAPETFSELTKIDAEALTVKGDPTK